MNRPALTVLQTTLALMILLLGSTSVSAMLCQSVADEEPAIASQLVELAPGSIEEQQRRCELGGGDECDRPPPDGTPTVPQSQGPQRPRSALAIVADCSPSTGDNDIPTDLESGQSQPGFASELFRPPKNT